MREGHGLMERYLKKSIYLIYFIHNTDIEFMKKNRTKNTKELSKFDNYFAEQKS